VGKTTIKDQVEGRTSDLSKRFDRVEAIRGRFHDPKSNQGRRADLDVQRVKHGIWLDPAIIDMITDGFIGAQSALKPKRPTKAVYVETLLEYAMRHPEEIEAMMREKYGAVD
jgi:hypothetical protein